MLSLKIEGQGHIDLQPDNIIAFEEIKELLIETRPKAKCGVFYDIGEGLNTVIVENSYDVVQASTKGSKIELNILSGPNERRMSIPRGSVVYREQLVYTDEQKKDAENALPNTILKINLAGQIITVTSKETREELDLL